MACSSCLWFSDWRLQPWLLLRGRRCCWSWSRWLCSSFRFGCLGVSSSTFCFGSSLPFSRTRVSSIRCAKVAIWRAAAVIFRGFNAPIWFAVVLAITLGAQWGTLQQYFNQLLTTQDPQVLLQQVTEAQQASGFNISAFALGIVEKILQPLVGIAFVVLYLDSKFQVPLHMEPVVSAGEGGKVR